MFVVSTVDSEGYSGRFIGPLQTEDDCVKALIELDMDWGQSAEECDLRAMVRNNSNFTIGDVTYHIGELEPPK